MGGARSSGQPASQRGLCRVGHRERGALRRCLPAQAAPEQEEAALLRQAFDLVVVVALGGAAGLDASWPKARAAGWLALADAAVLSFLDPDSVLEDLSRLMLVQPHPLRLTVETLDEQEAHLVGHVDLDDSLTARVQLTGLIEEARHYPWRLTANPPPRTAGTPLALPCEMVARGAVTPLRVRRVLGVGRLRLVAGVQGDTDIAAASPGLN